MKNFLAVAVIFLLIGLSVAPSINANISKEALVEFTTEVCGLNGGKQTVKLSHKEAEEVEALFDSIRIRLNETDSREEAEEIFKEAVVELDKYGLLGGLSVNQAQRLLSNNFRYLRLLKHIRNDLGNPQKNNSEINNMFCLVAGKTTETISKSIGYSVCKGIGVIGVLLLVAGFSEM